MTRRPLRPVLASLVALSAVLALAACSDDGADPSSSPAPSPSVSSPSASSSGPASSAPAGPKVTIDGGYVALGDSYTAAPGVPTTETQTGCLRSDHNYPSLIAASLDATSVADVSCSGASTLSLVGAQQTTNAVLPAQFDALGDDTALVTIGMGGNDLDLFQTLVGTCAFVAQSAPEGAPCQAQLTAGGTDQIADKIAQIGERVTAAVAGVVDRAPNARVFVVGYPQPVPAQGTCPELPLAAGDYAFVRQAIVALDQQLQSAAEASDATYVDVLEASKGHDVCAGDEAWIQGAQSVEGEAIALHPFAVEQAAVAEMVLAELG
ncbi:GDSL-type esterase/lipase family protein [Nocardioides flavescens]|uniref:SGNH/GDSL hydrolase family protein n=1 Tax=Nocardioides flavescens TaxID=2691959 RepID=A0A6L7F1M2_9ACTN|nr:SGNH/GDSL hydrolase family protein [Nocardioides flavescens]